MSRFKPSKWVFPPLKKAFSTSFDTSTSKGLFKNIADTFITAYKIITKKDPKKIIDKSVGWRERWGITSLTEEEFKRTLLVMRFEVKLSFVVLVIAASLFLFYIVSQIWLGVFFSTMVILYTLPNLLLTLWRLHVIGTDQYITFNEWIKRT